MEELNHRKTPLGDKFEKTDFPIEAHAWDDMEKLLAAQKPKAQPLSIGGNRTLFLIGLVGLGIIWYTVSRKNATLETVQQTDLSLQYQTQMLDYQSNVKKNTPLKPTASSSKGMTVFSVKNTSNSDIYNQSIGDNAPVIQSALSSFEPKNESNIGVSDKKNSVNNGLIIPTNISQKSSFIKVSDLKNENQLPPQYQGNLAAILPILDTPLSDKNLEKKGENLDVKIVDMYKTDDNTKVPVLNENKKLSDINIGQNTDNQQIISQNTYVNAVLPLDMIALDFINSTAMTAERDAQVLQNVSNNSLIPLRKLMKGYRHQLDIGFGSATFSAPKYVNHFRLGYQYRLTPLFGLGLSGNYSIKVDDNGRRGFFFKSDLEGLLYFVNKRKFDFMVSAGYGVRYAKFDRGVIDLQNVKGKGFTLGLVGQYRPTEHWVFGLRADFREIIQNYDDQAFVLSFGRRF
jgi:hypothetical protein